MLHTGGAAAVRVFPVEDVVDPADSVVDGNGVPDGVRLAVADVGAQREAERVRLGVQLGRDAAADDGVLAHLVRRERQAPGPPVQHGLGVRRVVGPRVVREADVVGLHHELPDLGRQQLGPRQRRDLVRARVHQLEQVVVEPDRGDGDGVVSRRREQKAVGGD